MQSILGLDLDCFPLSLQAIWRSTRRGLRDESGQVLPWLALLMMFIFMALAALSLDIGHGIFIQKQLQASADAAALAGAQRLPQTDYATYAQNYGDKGKNPYAGGVTFNAPVVNGLCLKSVQAAPFNTPCSATQPNAVQVTETAVYKPAFAGMFGHHTMNISASSTAAGTNAHWNIAILLDTTPSMDFNDPKCGRGVSQLECAQSGISTLVSGLDPNTDSVSLFTFPGITVDSTDSDTTCSKGTPKVAPYVFPSTSATSYTGTSTPYVTGSGRSATTTYVTYQITPFSNTFSTSGDAFQIAIGNGKCSGMQTSEENTYLAGAIYAAQAALGAQQAALASSGIPSQNAMIILSDGNATAQESNPGGAWDPGNNDLLSTSAQVGGGTNYATSSGTYPSWVGQCGQEVDAAQAISGGTDGTRVYTIAYGSPTTSSSGGSRGSSANCASDVRGGNHPNITPCQAMQQMSTGYKSSTQDPNFFSDDVSGAGCLSNNSALADMSSIFNAIRGSLLYTRLIPNNTN